MRRNGVWGRIFLIQAFSEIYIVNVNIYELESTFKPSYKFINAIALNHAISLIYKNNDHYNSLNLKFLVILTRHSKKKQPKARKHIFDSKIKPLINEFTLLEKNWLLLRKSLVSIFKYSQSRLNSNESTYSHIYRERFYKQPYNKRKN